MLECFLRESEKKYEYDVSDGSLCCKLCMKSRVVLLTFFVAAGLRLCQAWDLPFNS